MKVPRFDCTQNDRLIYRMDGMVVLFSNSKRFLSSKRYETNY